LFETIEKNRIGAAELQGLFAQLDQEKLMGFVIDQSPYYPFMTSGVGPARQARLAV